MSPDEKAELTKLRADLADAKNELKRLHSIVPASSMPTKTKRIVNYGAFCTLEE